MKKIINSRNMKNREHTFQIHLDQSKSHALMFFEHPYSPEFVISYVPPTSLYFWPLISLF